MNSNLLKKYSRPSPLRRNRESGIALFSVLWVLLLLSTLAAAASFMARNTANLVHQSVEIAETEAALDGAIVGAIRDLSDETRSRMTPIDGTSTTWRDGEFEGELTIRRETGRIDLNTADSTLLEVFLQSQGLGNDEASRMASNLQSYVGGESAPVPIRPAQAALQIALDRRLAHALTSVNELKRVPGWTADQVICWAKSFTVYTGLPGVSLAEAGPAVANALQWGADHHIEGYAVYQKQEKQTTPNLESLSGTGFRIVVRSSGNMHLARTWVGRVTGEAERPTLTFRWDWDDEADVRCHDAEF